jgi:hypothetical protein
MVNLILPKRSRLSQLQHLARTRGMEHLIGASKDINLWTFHEVAREPWMSIETDHVFEARDTRHDRVVQPWQIHIGAADEHGSFEREHKRIIEAFTEGLIWLDQTIKQYRARLAAGHHGALSLPNTAEFNMSQAVKDMLHRGDHPNFFRS